MSDKKFTPQEAAVLVLKKAEELYKSSSLVKGDWAKIHSKLKREGYSEESADKIDGAIKAKMNKSDAEGHNPDAKADAQLGEQVEQDVKQHEESNSDPVHAEPQMKGHIKLAKFVGRMEHKKGQKSKEMDKAEPTPWKGPNSSSIGVNAPLPTRETAGWKGNSQSEAGVAMRQGKNEAAKKLHSETMREMKAQPKPKLPG